MVNASSKPRQAIEKLNPDGTKRNLRNPRLRARVAKASLARKASVEGKVIHPHESLRRVNSVV